jgi:hypothetical protein
MRNGINNLVFLIISLDKGFIACYKLKSFNTKEVGDLNTMLFLLNTLTLLTQKKEDGMKKLIIVAIAILLAMPVLSHAAPVNNKWDMTIVGFVGVFASYNDTNEPEWPLSYSAPRRSGTLHNKTNDFGNFAMNIDPRLGFLVKGPDTWGAKTSAYIEFDFAGMGTGASADNGEARIRQAFMQFGWAKDTITFGNLLTPYRQFGVSPSYGANGGTIHPLEGAFGGPRSTQLTWDHRWTKAFTTKFALVYPGQDAWKNTGAASIYTNGLVPNVEGGIKYASDSCGKIGNNMLAFNLSGIYGRKRAEHGNTAAGWSQKRLDGWYGQAGFAIPIIPERNMNKAGALLFFTEVSAGQGLNPVNGFIMPESYMRAGREYSSPRTVSYQAGMNLWFSNEVWMSAIYNSTDKHVSNYYNTVLAAAGTAETTWSRNQLYNLALFYMPNPAILTAIEYSRAHTNFPANSALGFQKHGTANSIRFGAYYYF